MSLVIAAKYTDGIVLAADAFVFDNDRVLTTKKLDFSKIVTLDKKGVVVAGVGSSWVFWQAIQIIDDSVQPISMLISKLLGPKWKELNKKWQEARIKDSDVQDFAEEQNRTLRPPSESALIIVRQDNIEEVMILDENGNLHLTKTFLFTGSGSALLRYKIQVGEIIFLPTMSLEDLMSQIIKAYRLCRADLFCSGIPTFVIITKNDIVDYSNKCLKIHQKYEDTFYKELLLTVLKVG
jgi:20S proteasome alpha/beta subunit